MNDIEKAIENLKMENELMQFDPNTGEDYPIELQNQDNQDLYKANLAAISALEEKLSGGWTNAIEKPSKSDDYLVYYHKKYDSCNFETNWHGICSFIDIYGGWQTEEGETILAWQPLPKPYKEVEQ